jgi:peptidoglycan hydrolase-like protein with peptidoglycan-binding domain
MARDFFSRSAGSTSPSGTIITDIQAALNAIGPGQISVDGLFGGQTTQALVAFQQSRQLPTTGNVSDATWTALMRSPEPPIFERCLQVTASFEGTGFTLVVGNFDGAGITWGIIGFTLVGGELGAVLSTINQRRPDLFTQAFGHDADEILQISGPGTSAADKAAWADSISRGSKKYNVAEPWRTYFHDLGSYRDVQKIQMDRARDVYWKIATRDVHDLALGEELDFLLMYDIAVQNGGMRSKSRLKKAQDAIAQQNPTSAGAKREIIAQVVADTITSSFKQDVLKRKMTIADGQGAVHGAAYALSNWGFLDGASPTTMV